MSEASPDFATAAWLLEDRLLPNHDLCRGITHDRAHPLRLMPTALNYKASILSFWQSKDFVHSTELSLDPLLWDVTIRVLYIKPSRPRNSLLVVQFMLT